MRNAHSILKYTRVHTLRAHRNPLHTGSSEPREGKYPYSTYGQRLDGTQHGVPRGHGVRNHGAANVHGVVIHNLLGILCGIDLRNQQGASGNLTVKQRTGNDQVANLNLRGQVLAVSRTVLGLLLGGGVNVGNCIVGHGDFLRAKTRGERGRPRICFGASHTRTV